MGLFSKRRKEDPADIAARAAAMLGDDRGACDDALRMVLPGAEQEDPESMYVAGICHLRHPVTGRSYEEARRWLSAAAAKDHPGAMYALGTMHEEGMGVPQSRARAAELYLKAAEKGDPRAQYAYAVMCESGDAEGDAEFWYSRAAESGIGAASMALDRIRSKKRAPGHRG